MGSTGRAAAPAAPKQGASRKHTMLSEGLKSRDSLKLSFNRSISEPGHAGLTTCPMAPLTSPPSLGPSLHPPKRCRMDGLSRSKPLSLAPPSSFLSPPAPPGGVVSLPASPCSESVTMQRSMVMQQATTISGDQLAKKLRAREGRPGRQSFLLLDCRPFIAYNVGHVRGAINVNCCDRFNRKRLQQGKATLADLATTKEGKELLKKRTWKEVFVYDECSDSLENLPSSHTLFLVMNALVEDHREPIMLLGGLRDFQVSHRTLCEDHLMHNNNRPPNTASSSPSSKFLPDLPSPSDLCDTKDIENHPATQVLPHLYLGNMRDASDMASLSRLNIRYVLNVTAKQPSYHLPPGFHYKHLEAADNGLQNLRQFFEEAFSFIDEAKKAGAGVLVHCQAGISRSPTIAVAYLMKHYPMAMADAYKFVKTKRSIISPNLNFMGQLWEFEQVLNDEAKESGLKNGSSTASVVASNTNTFMWSQSNDVSKTVDGIYASPAAMNGCSV